MFYHLPPVGNRVSILPAPESKLPVYLSAENAQFYASGTAALAAAISVAIALSGKLKPEIILPAYACPDLVSAVCFTGATPVLVDIEPERPWYDLSLLSAATTENTVAIVGVNLFGIAERWQALRELIAERDIVLIEDSAQYFPGSDELVDWQGDLVVFSFGRGKPVGMLGGGAVFANRARLYDLLPQRVISPVSCKQRLVYNAKAVLYNLLISPRLYWLPQKLPFLHLGDTRYHPLGEIAPMDQQRKDMLVTNVYRYQNDDKVRSNIDKISAMLSTITSMTDIPLVCNTKDNRRLLRYPLLLDSASRDRVYFKLQQAGLGASVMYPASLPKISGIQQVLNDSHSFINADAFAARILTLPVHSGVSDADIKNMKMILMEMGSSALNNTNKK